MLSIDQFGTNSLQLKFSTADSKLFGNEIESGHNRLVSDSFRASSYITGNLNLNCADGLSAIAKLTAYPLKPAVEACGCFSISSHPKYNFLHFIATRSFLLVCFAESVVCDSGCWQSTTTPAKPMTHDRLYCFLPYWDNKPCMHIRSVWPDYRKRMYNSNIIARITETLVIISLYALIPNSQL